MSNFDSDGGSRRPALWTVSLLILVAAAYLCFAYLKEWQPFPHRITPAELSAKKNYDHLQDLFGKTSSARLEMSRVDLRITMLRGSNYYFGGKSSDWPSTERKKLEDLQTERADYVTAYGKAAETFNAYMQQHGHPFTTDADIPVIVKDPKPLPHQINPL